MRRAVFISGVLLFSLPSLQAEERKSLAPELIVCSQNLHNFGVSRPGSKRSAKKVKKQKEFLLSRFVELPCDLIAVQEVGGSSKENAQKILQQLSKALSEKLGRDFRTLVGETNDSHIRNGIIYDAKRMSLLHQESFIRSNLARMQSYGRNQRFVRGPLLGRFSVPGVEGSPSRVVSVFSFHLKSKANGWKDYSKTMFEVFRMRSAEALRTLARKEQQELGETGVVLIAGDLNSLDDSATARLLSGVYRLDDFKHDGNCVLSKKLEPSCRETPINKQEFHAVLGGSGKTAGEVATYRYKGKLQLIDDIYLGLQSKWMLLGPNGDYRAGVMGTFLRGSDHKMTWAELNW